MNETKERDRQEKKARPRVSHAERIEGLKRRGEFERETLANEVAGLRGLIDEKRARWKIVAMTAGIGAAAWTVGQKLFGKNSLSAKIGRLTSAAQILFGLGKAAGKFRKFW
jgi:hypothetical protein